MAFGKLHVNAMRGHLRKYMGTPWVSLWATKAHPTGGPPCLIQHAAITVGQWRRDDPDYLRFGEYLAPGGTTWTWGFFELLNQPGFPERVLRVLDSMAAEYEFEESVGEVERTTISVS